MVHAQATSPFSLGQTRRHSAFETWNDKSCIDIEATQITAVDGGVGMSVLGIEHVRRLGQKTEPPPICRNPPLSLQINT